FGLNTLGGALSMDTKSGLDNSGWSVELSYGSHLRRSLEFQYGGSNPRGWHWYVAGNRLGENGWRTDSHTDIRQTFAKFGRHTMGGDIAATVAFANNSLN